MQRKAKTQGSQRRAWFNPRSLHMVIFVSVAIGVIVTEAVLLLPFSMVWQTQNIEQAADEVRAAHHKAERARELRAAAEAARRAAVQHDAEAEHLELESEADAYDVQQALETAPDLEAMRARLDQVEADNAKVRDNERRAAVAERLEKRRLAVEGLTASLAEIDEEKRAAIERAEFPLEGLGFAEEGVTLGGIPFAQASAAERLRASVAIGLALHPDLRVLLVREGALLDDDALRLVGELAAAHEAQVWVERVGDGDEGAIVIEDGAVISTPGTASPERAEGVAQ